MPGGAGCAGCGEWRRQDVRLHGRLQNDLAGDSRAHIVAGGAWRTDEPHGQDPVAFLERVLEPEPGLGLVLSS